jgi:hypothetical protein
MEQTVRNSPKFMKELENYCDKHSTGFEELLKSVELIDSSYKVGDREGVIEAPGILRSIKEPQEILNNSNWIRRDREFKAELRRIFDEPPDEVHGVLLKRLHTKYHVISSVTRRIAWDSGRNTVVINTGLIPGRDQLYARSNHLDLRPLILKAKQLGINAGGKKDVIGVIVSTDKSEEFLGYVIGYMKNQG